jgi:DNA-binding NarL/FixJ family response regulator
VASVTRVAVIDPQPALRTGVVTLLRAEPGLVPVGTAAGSADGHELLARERPDVVLLEHRLLDGDGIALCRRLKSERAETRVLLYTAQPDDEVELLARVAGADGLVDKAAPPYELFEAIRRVARGQTALPPLTREQLDAAAHRVEPDDLALLAMLVDRTPPADVAATLHMDRRRVAKRTERVLGRLRRRPAPHAAA